MKTYILLLCSFACMAMEDGAMHNGKPVYMTNNITLTNTQPPRIIRPGPKHQSVIQAHERTRLEQEERDAMTCCCFFKIKKRI